MKPLLTVPLPTAYGGACSGCHEGVAAAYRLSGDLTAFYGSGAIADRPSLDDVSAMGISCQTCHDSHSADNPGQLRTVADVQLVAANGETPIITDGGVGKLCMQCHHARRSGDNQVVDGYAHFGPHGSPQADMMASESAYQAVAPADFVWADPSHLKVQNSCKTCHINMVEYDGTTAVTGHTFEPTVEACANCHGTINNFRDIMALEDFDGNGTIGGVQDEVEGLMAYLEEALNDSFATAGLDPTADDWDLIHELGIVTHYPDVNDSTNTFDVPIEWREAGYNLAFTSDDKSLGIHNPDYAIQILQQSINYLTGTLPSAMIVSNDQTQTVAKW
ncbi:MAG: ammonia-forming cytochrome c nitrite reductase subunit c552 [Planctomycetia bacterium]|nr:ammonia-forming cytochrome c nitrite reductase subunit c552 [Planctomycetia bacterium]